MAVQPVSEFPATAPEQIEHFAKLLSKSEEKRSVFSEVYRGQRQKPRTAAEIAEEVGLSAKRVLEIASPLAANHLFEKTKVGTLIAYKKYGTLNTVKSKILALATNQNKLKKHVTIRNPRVRPQFVKIELAPKARSIAIDVRHITVDDIDNFSRVRSLPQSKVPKKMNPPRLPEKDFKLAVARILGNRGIFKDWGGERNDLYTTHVKVKGRRYAAAFGFKGPGKSGVLTPGKMGKNGDQIQRLFDSAAQVMFVQYEGEIAESVSAQMQKLAIAKSVSEGQRVFYGIIALEDSYRLRAKYKAIFQKATRKRRNGKRER
ncbi:MAG: hypothetical protein LAN63_06585 [Acidobacteriia bacterium]|nr:hypothetical protein [Terriglobia bacterium]